MKRIKYGIMIFMAMCFLGVNSVFALTVQHVTPNYDSGGPIDTFVSAYLTNILNDIDSDVGTIDSTPKKLAESFANAGTYSNFAATQRGYQGYDLFAVTLGTMFAGHMSSYDVSQLKDLKDDLKNKGDVEVGAGWQAWAMQVGLNTSPWLLDGLYLGLKLGVVKFNMPIGDNKLKVDYISIGAIADYQILKARSITGAFVWRGITVESGLLYQKNATGVILDVAEPTPQTDGTYSMSVDPSLTFALDSNIVTIPLEINTAIRIAWFLNLSIGVGADINFGKSDLVAKLKGDIKVYDNTDNLIEPTTPGYIYTNAGVKGANPKVFAPKAMVGLGFCAGPVMIDIPVTFYFPGGFNVGISAGFVW
ncbi:MAG: hypothetical protein CVV44_07695 [Spirochaetae bacterium HGW-Spirochaetae-1]|jgi:hypothetical protein|nr:MAG: hypothetical protein CVV44_07695 [Spirochaetae bacterium HGW-Spirochaetae-1]